MFSALVHYILQSMKVALTEGENMHLFLYIVIKFRDKILSSSFW
jgi:hypothetical protein